MFCFQMFGGVLYNWGFDGVFILPGACVGLLSENIRDNISVTFKKVEKILITDMSM